MQIIHGLGKRLPRLCRRLLKTRVARRLVFPALVHWKTLSARCDWNLDLFFAYPPASQVTNAPASYEKLYQFYIGNKRDQWHVLREYFKCPEIDGPPYVVRPLRHERGERFEISETLPPDSRATTHYWRSLWERSCEYRVYFIRGRKTLVLLKRVPDGTSQRLPWNVGLSSFVTVHDEANDRLRHSKFYEKAQAFLTDYPFQFLCVDVLYSKHKHRVVEVNFSPNVSIPENLDLLARAMVGQPTTTNAQQVTVRV